LSAQWSCDAVSIDILDHGEVIRPIGLGPVWAAFRGPQVQTVDHRPRPVQFTGGLQLASRSSAGRAKARGHFPTERATLKCVYMAVMSLDPTDTGSKRWMMRWKPALNAFEIAFDGRLAAGRK
jgi:hypothetical protein